MNPYRDFVSDFADLYLKAKSLPLGGIPPHTRRTLAPDAPVSLILSPHPDDECLVGGLALRLMREQGMRTVNVAVTLGSNKDRQRARRLELTDACGWLGFDLELTAPNGLERITPKARQTEPEHWATAVRVVAASLVRNHPQIIFFPHAGDWNGTHIGTHYLAMDALKSMPPGFECLLIETEFWAPMPSPNLMVELSTVELADLIAALSFHVGEVKRNPYHLRLPAWMQDNVRRGAELVGGQGGVAPDFMFATLYRVSRWKDGLAQELCASGSHLGLKDRADEALGSDWGFLPECEPAARPTSLKAGK